ncbi:MAG: hypothetical protein KBD78_01195 [Oligoflexales bacterium]|nr:hypothetical protein [Oligoflexales bacterium]
MWIDDLILEQSHQDIFFKVLIPQSTMVVLGSANSAEKECQVEACKLDGVPILKRYGGGGTVVLYPGCIVISLGVWVKNIYHNDKYFKSINQAIIRALASYNSRFSKLTQNGISDIVHGEKKIAGTSIFRSRNYLLYQASLIWSLDIELIERYLQHPSREPAYRNKKSHRDFLSDLKSMISSPVESDAIDAVAFLNKNVSKFLVEELNSELIPSCSEQVPHLLKRANKAL